MHARYPDFRRSCADLSPEEFSADKNVSVTHTLSYSIHVFAHIKNKYDKLLFSFIIGISSTMRVLPAEATFQHNSLNYKNINN